ncbi:hypothetical protein RHMOL_Rhmol04G0140700 [Rhododendron molle]|uniref:Uncharacterized protein n=1 Tax=Rhododendron molle TaxID=49168 RepID=A0ACC0P054_RHOML|nr:hypothetical protein RHMOL_Rhmol04G0140700 [Rhododendron molle]
MGVRTSSVCLLRNINAGSVLLVNFLPPAKSQPIRSRNWNLIQPQHALFSTENPSTSNYYATSIYFRISKSIEYITALL